MTNIKNIYCMDINWINEEINDLQEQLNISESQNDKTRAGIEHFQLKILKDVKTQLKSITPLIEDTFNEGRDGETELVGSFPFTRDVWKYNREKYINTKQFEL